MFRYSDNYSQKKPNPAMSRWGSHLNGKVILLAGTDTAVLYRLIDQFVQKGADIALLYQQMSQETIENIEKCVRAADRRLLLLQQEDPEIATAVQVVARVMNELGRLDIFIDLSLGKRELLSSVYDQKQSDGPPNWLLT